MGRDKAFVPWNGANLLQGAIGRLADFGPARLLSGDAADLERAKRLEQYGALVPDRVAGGGPLGGVDAALQEVGTVWALIVPVDQPRLPAGELLQWAEEVCASTAKASWFTHPGGVEPLPLLLHRSLGPAIAQAFAEGQRRLLPVIRTIVGNEGLPAAVDHPEWFQNLNRPEDLDVDVDADRVD